MERRISIIVAFDCGFCSLSSLVIKLVGHCLLTWSALFS
ncbi:hypothetical protein AALB_2050 [Agarivorans albus MKT 106]|uniref:Uncharacterized protein n=1 Tax=Agarivorans albus MKT 106 TaxID=1331007 RepID=R9PKV7_AGAAL|nr:hypothetical protein AALB_2050 [Agarivorans albus MKT 106]